MKTKKIKYYSVADVLFYKKVGAEVFFAYKLAGADGFSEWKKKKAYWLEQAKHFIYEEIKPINLKDLKMLGLNP